MTLLSEPGPYRSEWVHLQQRRRTGINQSAVALVLSRHLWETGEVPDTDTGLPRRMKDRVSRAISGQALSPALLRVFIDAFRMDPADSAELWRRFLGGTPETSVLAVQPDRLTPSPYADGRAHRTLASHEFHTLGPDRIPVEHRTVQVIIAEERTPTYSYRFDTSAAAVQVLRGGRAASVRATDVPGIFAAEIRLSAPLEPGETASLEYRTIFTYSSPPEPVLRRVALTELQNLDLHVQFDPGALPRAVEWCLWDAADYTGEPVAVEEVEIGPDLAVHRYLETLCRAGAGFRWRWGKG